MREIHRVLAPGGLLGLADLFGSRRRGLVSHLARRASLPPTYRTSLKASGLHIIGVSLVDGFGPVSAITVVLAQRRGPDTRRRFTGRATTGSSDIRSP